MSAATELRAVREKRALRLGAALRRIEELEAALRSFVALAEEDAIQTTDRERLLDALCLASATLPPEDRDRLSAFLETSPLGDPEPV